MKKMISIVVPVFNNSASLEELVTRILDSLKFENSYGFELIFVDDGSRDDSWQRLLAIKRGSRKDFNIRILKLSRNFGQMAAILAGLQVMSGDGAVIMSADLQDPPERIPSFLREIESGATFVIATRKTRRDALSARLTSKIAYFFIRRKYQNFPRGGFDFFFISREISNQLLRLKGRYRYIQPELMSFGFTPHYIESIREGRRHGKSQHSFSKRFDFFLTAMLDFSPIFLRRLSLLGFIGMMVGLILSFIAIYQRIFGQVPFSGFTTVFCLIVFLGGLQLTTLSIIGEYVWRIFDTSREKPYYIVEKSL
jgi:glycosyltransferase involved in cell wall biosynthesis